MSTDPSSGTTPEPLATWQELQSSYRQLTEPEQQDATVLLQWASALLRSKCPDLDRRVAAGTLDPDLPRLVVCEMVKRAVRNPEGLRTDVTGPYSATWDAEAASGHLEVTDADLAKLAPPVTRRRRRIGSARLYRGLA